MFLRQKLYNLNIMKLSFHGGTRRVTGACYLLETSESKILVDCGLFQDCEECSDLNFEPFKFKPSEIDFVFVTHAHVDHVGRIPRLVKEGFSGAIYSTAPTKDIAALILEDAMRLEKRRHEDFYAPEDLEKAMKLWQSVPYGEVFSRNGLKFRFNEAGHILGSAFVEIWAEERHFLFTGDFGNTPSVLLPPPSSIKDMDYLIIESTYGNRTHEDSKEAMVKLERAMEDIVSRRGTLMIPAFAAERTQDILFLLNELLLFKRVPEIPVFVDSPLAISITGVFEKYPSLYRTEIQELFLKHPNLFRSRKLQFTETVEESKKINDVPPPKVIIAGSGMMAGGRILHHARRYLSDPKSILLITGYQSGNSLGRRLLEGEKMVKILGEEIVVEAEIRQISGFSAHADSLQLFSFVEAARDNLKRVFVVQGEEEESLHFMQEIKDRLGIEAEAPTPHQEFEI